MTSLRRLVAAISAASFVLLSALPSEANARIASVASSARSFAGDVGRSPFPARDLGRRAAGAPIAAAVMLRYNHEAELESLIEQQSDARSPLFHRYLTSAQFDAYFAPTTAQHAYVIAKLQAAGLRIVQTAPNRTIVDIVGSSGAAERFFGTEIHSFVQSGHGLRFANVRPATVSADLAPLVRSVTLSNFVVVRSRPRSATLSRARMVASIAAPRSPARHAVAPGRFTISDFAPRAKRHIAAAVVQDPGFESGAVGNGWRRCQTAGSRSANIVNAHPETGSYAAFAGSTGTSEQLGYSGICQQVTIPSGGATLSADLYETSTESDATYAGQDVYLVASDYTIAAIVQSTIANTGAYATHTWDLSNFAGQTLYLYFGVHGDGAASTTTQQYVDNVSIVAGTPGASVPKVVPNLNPTACTGSAENGPLTASVSGTSTHLPTGIATTFDFPVQHGCDGKGEVAAIVIDGAFSQSDLTAYLKAAAVTQTGTVTVVPIDGGGTAGDDDSETMLDIETVVGLAPAATVSVYNPDELTLKNIADAYNRVVSDNTAVAVNSSFGGCENDFGQYDEEYDGIFVQGAALGITFVGTSGDTGSYECYDGPGGANSEGVSSNNSPHSVSIGSVNYTANGSGTLTGIQGSDQNPNGAISFPSGGGVSQLYALPRYQMGVAGVIASGRNQPDLALPGDDCYEFQGGQAYPNGGTSWSGPMFTALLTTAAQIHQIRGFGFANPTIYQLFKTTGYRRFFIDSTTGNNAPSGMGDYQAATGYDQVTGIGVPEGYAFAKVL